MMQIKSGWLLMRNYSVILSFAILLGFFIFYPLAYATAENANKATAVKNDDRGLAVVEKNRDSRKRVALVIGNSNYQYPEILPKLKNPANDAEDISKALRGFGFEVIEKKNQTKESMDQAIVEFSRKIGDSEAALFYFAGHGMQVDGKNYLIPIDAKIETKGQVIYKSTDINEILVEMEHGKSRANIVLLDACRNNPITGKYRTGATRGLAMPTNTPKGTVIAYATEPGNVAADGSGRNGLFTAGLLKAFKGNDLTLGGVLAVASEEVERISEQTQTPYINGPATLQKKFKFAMNSSMTDMQPVALWPALPVPVIPEPHASADFEVEPQKQLASIPKDVPVRSRYTADAEDEEKPPNTISVKIKTPRNARLIINNKEYDLNMEPIINFPFGITPFTLYLTETRQTIYGLFDVKILDETTKAWTFGLEKDKGLFKELHIERSLRGQPVFYGMRTNTDNGLNEVFKYTLSLQKIK